MVDITEFSKEAGNWLKATYVQMGDLLEVIDPGYIDNTTFEKPYLCISIKLKRTGEDFNVRIGTKNIARISQTLGTETGRWLGNFFEVIGIETYPGLGQKGMLLRGVANKELKQSQPQQTPADISPQERAFPQERTFARRY